MVEHVSKISQGDGHFDEPYSSERSLMSLTLVKGVGICWDTPEK